jgi:hypothetical protein
MGIAMWVKRSVLALPRNFFTLTTALPQHHILSDCMQSGTYDSPATKYKAWEAHMLCKQALDLLLSSYID